jgi:hypothetical protein
MTNLYKLFAEVDLYQPNNRNERIMGRMNAQSHTFRLRAIQSEQRAAAASDLIIKAEWEALAIEWHALASAVSRSSGEDDQIDFA